MPKQRSPNPRIHKVTFAVTASEREALDKLGEDIKGGFSMLIRLALAGRIEEKYTKKLKEQLATAFSPGIDE